MLSAEFWSSNQQSTISIFSLIIHSPFAIQHSAFNTPLNLPNAITIARIFLVPLLVVVLLTKFEGHLILGVRKELVGAAIFGIASLTDWLDGYLARRRKQVTPLGQFMDPLADKLLITAALVSWCRWTWRSPGWWS